MFLQFKRNSVKLDVRETWLKSQFFQYLIHDYHLGSRKGVLSGQNLLLFIDKWHSSANFNVQNLKNHQHHSNQETIYDFLLISCWYARIFTLGCSFIPITLGNVVTLSYKRLCSLRYSWYSCYSEYFQAWAAIKLCSVTGQSRHCSILKEACHGSVMWLVAIDLLKYNSRMMIHITQEYSTS